MKPKQCKDCAALAVVAPTCKECREKWIIWFEAVNESERQLTEDERKTKNEMLKNLRDNKL